jgi:hypothetical protein
MWNSVQQNKEMKRILRPHANRVMNESYGEVQGLTEQVQQLISSATSTVVIPIFGTDYCWTS